MIGSLFQDKMVSLLFSFVFTNLSEEEKFTFGCCNGICKDQSFCWDCGCGCDFHIAKVSFKDFYLKETFQTFPIKQTFWGKNNFYLHITTKVILTVVFPTFCSVTFRTKFFHKSFSKCIDTTPPPR